MSRKTKSLFPEPSSPDAFVSITPFGTCNMQCQASIAIDRVPGQLSLNSWRYFVQHAPSGTKLWFDLGVSHDLSAYPPYIQENQHKVFNLTPGTNSPVDDVKSLGAKPDDVKYIIASHAHWDHIFPAGKYFPKAIVLCGKGTLRWAADSWPDSKDSTFDGRIWDPNRRELPLEELPAPKEAPEKWRPLGPFKNCHDFFGDGSFWIGDAPGRCPGNLAALVRTRNSAGKTKWAFLGGDCFHCAHFIHHPEAPFRKGVKVTPTDSFHEEEEPAREIIRQVAEMKRVEGEDAWIWPAHFDSLEGVWEL